jgi:hypothetical protein
MGSVEDLLPVHSHLPNVLSHLTQKWHEQEPEDPAFKELLKILAFRISFVSASIENLITGTVRGKYTDNPSVFEDLPSLYTLARSQIEAYLTLFGLYIGTEDDDDREWQYNLFVAHAYQTRQHVDSDMFREQLAIEKQDMIDRVAAIQANPAFQCLELQERNRILPPAKPIPKARRKGWEWLIKSSPLNTDEFKDRWGLYSNHAHTEYIGLIQFRDFAMTDNPPPILLEQIIKCSMMIQCVFIIDFVQYIGLNAVYSSLPAHIRRVVDFFHSFATREV